MAERLPMGQKELYRAKLLQMVQEGQITLRTAAVRMGVSERQAKRLWSRYREGGDAALVHGNVGKQSNRRIDEAVRRAALSAYRQRYADFGPTLAAENLAERDGLCVDHETLRRWLLIEGLWQRSRRRNPYRSRRERRQRFGELVQFDGSHHRWFEDRGQSCCLMNMVDDATGTSLSFLCEGETTEAAMRLLWAWIERYGLPQALYCDRKNSFVIDREANLQELLAGRQPEGPFQLACRRLGIELIVARSPQAKGRVERSHGVYQDRFVKELRLEGISSIEEANQYLKQHYLPRINARFAQSAAQREDAHVPLLLQTDLREIFCFEEQRVVSRDFVVQFHRRVFQILPQRRGRPQPGHKVVVRRWLDGQLHFRWKDKPLLVQEIQITAEKEDSVSLPA